MKQAKRHALHSISSISTSLENLQSLNESDAASRQAVCQTYTQRAALERHNSNMFFQDGTETAPGEEPAALVREREFLRLRDIIEDYLEVHRSAMSAASASKYLAVSTLGKYFRILQVEMGDLVFDVNDVADQVSAVAP